MSSHAERRESGLCGHAGRCVAALAALALVIGAACGGAGGGGEDDDEVLVLAGSIPAAGGMAADSDVNTPSAPYTSNDTPQDAQPLANPVTVGGYVNVPGAGAPGRSRIGGDPVDLYAVALAVGQSIRLLVADQDTVANDLDLRLLDASDASEVAVSDGVGSSEEIVVPSTGDYLVEVSAVAGASNYVLTIGQTLSSVVLSAAAASPPDAVPPREAFVPGEVIVRYREDLLGPAAAQGPAQRAASAGMRHVAGARGEPQLLAAREEGERRQAFQALGIGHLWSDVDGQAAAARRQERLRQDTRRLAKALRRRPEIAATSLNYVRRTSAVPDDDFYPLQWHYEQIHLPQAWDAVSDDSGVVVAVLDTGIRTGHPDFAGQLVAGYDFITSAARANDEDGCDADPLDVGDQAAGGSSFHGTHVAGTVAARTSLGPGGDTGGGAGVAWNARIQPVRVLGVDGGTDFDIMGAIRFAVGRGQTVCPGAGTNPTPAPIVNLSLGGSGFNQVFQDLVDDVTDPANEGAILVAAAGNQSSTEPSYPAAYEGVISVSAVGPSKNLAPYSNFGPTIDVAAPGGDFSRDVDGDGNPDGVLSTFFRGDPFDPAPPPSAYGYALAQGTSMAVPHVAGVVALMLDVNPDLTGADVANLLNAGELTEDVGDPSFYGNGLIDAVKAVNAAAAFEGGSSPIVDPVLRVNPDSLNFGLLADAFTVSVANGGGDDAPLQVLGTSFTSADGPWLAVTPASVDADGLGSYEVTIDRSGLADGLYTGTLSFESNVNDVDVPVIMQVGDPLNAQADAGHHFVLLVEEGTLASLAEIEVDAVEGVYRYRFEDVPPGRYQVVAGTDMDDDGLICDPGEACGAWPTLDTIVTVEVPGSRTDLDFVTGFRTSLGSGAASRGGAGARSWPREGRRRFEAP